MAKRIVWAAQAKVDRFSILDYWKNHNKSRSYSRKLNQLFREAIRRIQEHPKVGKLTNDNKARIKIVSHFLIIYEIFDDEIVILRVWDSRQNPQKLKY